MSYTNLLEAYIHKPQTYSSTVPKTASPDYTQGLIRMDDLHQTNESLLDSRKGVKIQRPAELPRALSPSLSRQYASRQGGNYNLQNSLSSSKQRIHIIDETSTDDLADITLPEKLLKKRNEQVNHLIEALLSGRKVDNLDTQPSRQRDTIESLKSNINSQFYLTNTYTANYLTEEQPDKGAASQNSDFFPTKKPSKNEYKIDEYLPTRTFFRTENQGSDNLMALSMTSPVASQPFEPFQLNRLGRVSSKQILNDLVPERLQRTYGDRTDVGSLQSEHDTLMRKLLETGTQIEEPAKGREQGNAGELQKVFEVMLTQLKCVNNPKEVAEVLVHTINQASEKTLQGKPPLSASQLEGSAYQRNNQDEFEGSHHVEKGVQKVSRACQTWSNHLSFERTQPVEFVPTRNRGENRERTSAVDSPIQEVIRPGKALVQTEKAPFGNKEVKYSSQGIETERNYDRNRPSKGSYETSSFSVNKSYYLTPNYSTENLIKIHDSPQSILKSTENLMKSRHNSSKSFGLNYAAAVPVVEKKKSIGSKENLFQRKDSEKDLVKDIENKFLETLQLSQKKFTSHISQKVVNSKLETFTDTKKESTSTKIRDNLSPSYRFDTSVKSPVNFFSIREKEREERKEDKGLRSKNDYSSLKRNASGSLGEGAGQSEEGLTATKQWKNIKFFEDEDLELLIKSYI